MGRDGLLRTRFKKGEGFMAGNVKPIPEGFRTVTPHLTVSDGNAAIEFYKKAFGAEEIMRPFSSGITVKWSCRTRRGA